MLVKLPQFPSHAQCTACELHLLPAQYAEEGKPLYAIGVPTIHLSDSLAPSPTTPAIVFVGQNPGYLEVQHNVPFIGESGIIFRGGYVSPTMEPSYPGNARRDTFHPGAYLDADPAIRPLASIYVTNAVRCWTVNNDKPKWKDHHKPCHQHLLTDLTTILALHSKASKVLIVCLGSPASKHILQLLLGEKAPRQQDLFKQQARLYTLRDPLPHAQVRVFHTYHPAYIIRNPQAAHTVARHMRLVHALLTDTLPSPTTPAMQRIRPPQPAS